MLCFSPLETFDASAVVSSGKVHVVRITLDAHSPVNLEPLLDEKEHARAARFVRDVDRCRFVVAHGVTRIALGQCLGIPPMSVRFAAGARGKPALEPNVLDLRFNLSYGGNCALLALALGLDVGVDIEQERPLDSMKVARDFFAQSEYEAIRALPPDRQLKAFFRCWTRKESFVKALGDGLRFPLSGFEVSVDERLGQSLLECRAAPHELARWTVVSLDTDDGYAAALTTQREAGIGSEIIDGVPRLPNCANV
jgi:4'-phosphopantetheinyl transferase